MRPAVSGDGGTNVFGGGCVGGVCRRPTKKRRASASIGAELSFSAWNPPDSIARVILRVAEIAGAHMGSVEFLLDEKTGLPYFFDLNMVSTLPNTSDGSVADPGGIWGSVDFYEEASRAILSSHGILAVSQTSSQRST